MDRYLMISADCHAGPRPDEVRPYLDPEWREAHDAWLADEAGQAARRAEHIGAPLFADEAVDEFEEQAAWSPR